MLIRTNPCYRPQVRWDATGLLLITRRWIVATRIYARCWS